jgi:hypothetical protein
MSLLVRLVSIFIAGGETMRRAIKLMLILMGSSVLGTSALALVSDDCPHAVATIGALRQCVMHAREHGHIDNTGVAQSLLAKVDAAEAAFDLGKLAVAINILEAFVEDVEAQAGSHIEQPEAGHLAEHALAVIQALVSP